MKGGESTLGAWARLVVGIGLCLALAFVIRLPTFSVGLHGWDELWFLAGGRSLLEAGPYGLVFTINPLLSLANALIFVFTGVDAFAVRLAVAVLTVGMGALTAWAGSRARQGWWGVAGGLVCVLYASLPQFQGALLTKELLANQCVPAAVAVLLGGLDRRRIVVAGLLLGVGFCFRQTVAVFGMAFFAWLALADPGLPWMQRLRRLVLFTACCAAPFVAEGLAAAVAGRFSQHVAFYSWLMAYNDCSITPGYGAKLSRIWSETGGVLRPLLALAALGLAVAWTSSRRGFALLGLWTLASLVDVAMVGNFFPHYLLVLFPPLGLLAGFALWWTGKLLGRLHRWADVAWRGALLFLALVPAGQALGVVPGSQFARGPWVASGGWDGIMQAVQYLKEHRQPGQTYMALAAHPNFYVALGQAALPRALLAQEFFPPLGAFLWSDVTGRYFYDYRERQQALMEMMRSRPPHWFVLDLHRDMLRAVAELPELHTLLAQFYILDYSSGQELIYRLRDQPLQRPPGPMPASLLVRTVRLRTVAVEDGTLVLNGVAIQDDQGYAFRYALPSLLAWEEHGPVAIEDVTALPPGHSVREALAAVGLTVRQVTGAVRREFPAGFEARGMQPLEIVTGIPERGERVFLRYGSRDYEGYGSLGRVDPVAEGHGLGAFRIRDDPEPGKPLEIYVLGGGSATVYAGRFEPHIR